MGTTGVVAGTWGVGNLRVWGTWESRQLEGGWNPDWKKVSSGPCALPQLGSRPPNITRSPGLQTQLRVLSRLNCLSPN